MTIDAGLRRTARRPARWRWAASASRSRSTSAARSSPTAPARSASLAALPLADGYTVTFRNFDVLKQKVALKQAEGRRAPRTSRSRRARSRRGRSKSRRPTASPARRRIWVATGLAQGREGQRDRAPDGRRRGDDRAAPETGSSGGGCSPNVRPIVPFAVRCSFVPFFRPVPISSTWRSSSPSSARLDEADLLPARARPQHPRDLLHLPERWLGTVLVGPAGRDREEAPPGVPGHSAFTISSPSRAPFTTSA